MELKKSLPFTTLIGGKIVAQNMRLDLLTLPHFLFLPGGVRICWVFLVGLGALSFCSIDTNDGPKVFIACACTHCMREGHTHQCIVYGRV
jgi:hypothetical protein|tara:strand:+ start:380 stop:649 length:270 start_codon:yes stop_codon:yes gene_type:complete